MERRRAGAGRGSPHHGRVQLGRTPSASGRSRQSEFVSGVLSRRYPTRILHGFRQRWAPRDPRYRLRPGPGGRHTLPRQSHAHPAVGDSRQGGLRPTRRPRPHAGTAADRGTYNFRPTSRRCVLPAGLASGSSHGGPQDRHRARTRARWQSTGFVRRVAEWPVPARQRRRATASPTLGPVC